MHFYSGSIQMLKPEEAHLKMKYHLKNTNTCTHECHREMDPDDSTLEKMVLNREMIKLERSRIRKHRFAAGSLKHKDI